MGNDLIKACQATLWISGMNNSGRLARVHGAYTSGDGGTSGMGSQLFGRSGAAATYDRFQLYPSSGTFTTGRATLYGIAHA